jgi:hypothetical protein
MKRYKFTDSKNDVVHQIDEDGKSRMSCAIDHACRANISKPR